MKQKSNSGSSMKRKKFFHHTLFSYFVLVLISLASSVLIYQFANRQLIEKSTATDRAAFQQFTESMNADLRNANDKVLELQKDSGGTMQLLRETEMKQQLNYASVVELGNKLRLVSTNSFSDIFLYLPSVGKIVSATHTTMRPEDYFPLYYTDDYTVENMFDAKYAYDVVPITTKEGQHTVALRTALFSPTAYTIYCVIDPKRISERITHLEDITDGCVMLIDRDGKPLLPTSLPPDFDYSLIAEAQDAGRISAGGVTYVVFLQNSGVGSFQYVSLIPISSMYRSLSIFQLYTLINIGICCIFTVLLSVLLAKFNYRPVQHLMQSVSQLMGRKTPSDENDEEFAYMERVISNTLTEQTRYLSDLAAFQKLRKKNLVLNLITGASPVGSSPAEVFAEIGETLVSDRFVVMLFHIEEWDDTVFSENYADERPLLSNIILPNVIEELCGEFGRGYVVNMDHNRFVCLANLAETACVDHMKQIAERALSFLRDKMGISCTVGIGSLYTTLKDIRHSYGEALRAEESKIIAGTGKVLCYEQFRADKGSFSFAQSAAVRTLLMRCIKSVECNPEKAFDTVYAQCFDGRSPTAPEIARSFILDLCMQINALLREIDRQNSLSLSEHQFDLNIDTYKTIEGFREYFVRRISEINREYNERHSVKTLGENILDFIEGNYADVNLSVTEIGAQFNLTPSYLSKIFKQETNQSIPECICAIRTQHACRRLVETNDSLNVIAQDCGFTSSAVFIRSFKKICGVTPGDYRKLMSG